MVEKMTASHKCSLKLAHYSQEYHLGEYENHQCLLAEHTDYALSLQKNTTQSHKLQNDQGKTMIAKDSFVPLL